MVKAEDSWLCQQHSDWDSPNLNYVGRLVPPSQQIITPSCQNPCTFSSNVAFPGFSLSGLPGLKIGQANGDYGLSYCLPPLMESSVSPSNPYLKEPQFAPHRLGVKNKPNYVTSSSQKRFLIIDQSEHHARFFLSPFGSSSQNPISAPMKPVHLCRARNAEQVPMIEQISPTKPTIQGAYNENQMLGEGSEFHEDSEEINALLYSDDDEHDYDDGEDGEVTSTYHSQFASKVNLENYEEEVASSDSSSKRQRLLDGRYKKSSVVDATSSVKFDRPSECDNDAESSCARARTKGKVMDSNLGTKQLRKEKIHEKLRILENIIPGSKSKEPLLIIDEAISYLKSLKLKAKALGLGYP